MKKTILNLSMGAFLAVASSAFAQASGNDPFLLLLKGIYQSVKNAPNLGLLGINLNDGSFSVTDIHAINTVPGIDSNSNVSVGKFYTQLAGDLAVYDLPGGNIAMQFTAFGDATNVSDGQGGFYAEQTFELTILQATGIYKSFVNGHNHMVARTHILASGDIDENCVCIISLPAALALWWSSN